ncbi:hypothetical protein HYALB_00010629 [Hymenoscyphus albidus]|uniref:Uncharacterized protein n=1 Tax=Hymenoscyphus albidus TaxID=595503 RepID=A0A9N9LI04_9HELO|nr:hypothetical protein HYALB_00010629 [Hymenoscyphus albidus]
MFSFSKTTTTSPTPTHHPLFKNLINTASGLQDRAFKLCQARNQTLPYQSWAELEAQHPYGSRQYYERAKVDTYRHLKRETNKAVKKMVKNKRREEWKVREMAKMRPGGRKFWFWLRE